MNSPTANSSDTPSRTLMEDLRVTAYCRVWSDCREGGCKGTRARVRAGHKESVKSGFMRSLQPGFAGSGLALSRASPAPTGSAVKLDAVLDADSLWERACPRWRHDRRHRTRLAHKNANIHRRTSRITTPFSPLRPANTKWHAHCTRPSPSFPTVQGANA